MGYQTEFAGRVEVVPPLSPEEIGFLRKFAGTRRVACVQGPYYVDRGGEWGQADGSDVLDYNLPPEGQPGAVVQVGAHRRRHRAGTPHARASANWPLSS